jgi:hypothetical protein
MADEKYLWWWFLMVFNYVDQYRNYLDIDTSLSSDPITAANKKAAEIDMDTSYFTEDIVIGEIGYKVMVKQEKKSESKKLIFKPDIKVNIGEHVQLGEIHFLITDFLGDGVYEIYPTATLQQCNTFFPAITDKTRVLMRDEQGNVIRDKFGDPAYQWVGGEEFLVPCIVESSIKNSEKNNQLNLPDGRIIITMKYQSITNVKDNAEFMMYDNTYKIVNVDKTKVINEVGLMTITADIIPSEVTS